MADPVQLQLTAGRRAWLTSMRIDARAIRTYGLDRPMTELAWKAMVREVLRDRVVRVEGQRKRRINRSEGDQ